MRSTRVQNRSKVHVRKAGFKIRLFWLLLLAQAIFINAQTAPTRFAVIGDFGSGDSHEADVANLVKSWNPDFITTTGDNNYENGAASTIDRNIGFYYHDYIYPYNGSYGAGSPGGVNRFFPTLGNHDWNTTGALPYLNYFTLPGNERYYDFVRGPVHFFMIDSDSHEPDGIENDSVQAAWLQARLAASTAPWKIVMFHHTPYSSRTSTTKLRWNFQQWGASAVIAGHAHVYERVMINGFPYMTNGLGGESTGSFGTPVPGSTVRFASDYGAQLVTATNSSITFQFITRTGDVIDNFIMSIGVPATPANLTGTAFVTSVNLGWTDSSDNEQGFKVERCTGGGCTNFAEIAQLGSNVSSYNDAGRAPNTSYRYRVRAYNGTGNSDYSNILSVTTQPIPTIPTAPGGLAATAQSDAQIDLSWTDNSSNEDGFEIERCQNAGCTNFSAIGQIDANDTNFSDPTALAETTYRYRVRAFNLGGNSAYSNIAEATTAPPDTNLLSDDFNDNVRDPAKWQIGIFSRTASNFNSSIAVAEQNGRLSIAPLASVTGSYYSGYLTAATYALTDSQVSVEAVQKASSTAVTIFSVGVDKDNWYGFRAKGNSLYLEARRAGSTSSTTLSYNAALHRFWRFRHDPADDSINFETSEDGATWIVRRTLLREIPIGAVRIELIAGTGEAVSSPGTALFDNFKLERKNAPALLPTAPVGLTASTVSDTQVSLSWTHNGDLEEGFKIERCTGAGCTNFAVVAQVAANTTTFVDSGLLQHTTYRYRVFAFNAVGNSAFSNITEILTEYEPPPPPEDPSNLIATSVSTNQIDLAWTVNSDNEQGFKIERCTGAGCTDFAEIGEVGIETGDYSDTGLTANATYRYRVRAFNVGGNSGYTNIAQADAVNPQPPAAPTNLTASAISATQIDLAWADNADNENGVRIERCQNANCTDFAEIGQANANATTFSDTGRAPETTYRYQVRTFNNGGNSAYSNIAGATTGVAPPTPPTAPGSLTASAVSSSQINLSWIDNANNETGFKVERCQNPGCTNFAEIAQPGANAASYNDTGLAAGTAYRYRVRAFNTGGDSVNSNIAETATYGTGAIFVDDFNDGVRDAAKWNLGLFSYPASFTDSQVAVAEENGMLSISPRARITGNHFYGYVSIVHSDLTNGFASVKVVQKTSSNAQTVFSVGVDENNFFRFRSRGTTFFMETSVNGTVSTTSIAGTTQPRVWRFRHDPVNDSIVFETSADDGATWVVRRTVPRQIPITALRVELIAGTSESVTSPGTALFEDFRVEQNQ